MNRVEKLVTIMIYIIWNKTADRVYTPRFGIERILIRFNHNLEGNYPKVYVCMYIYGEALHSCEARAGFLVFIYMNILNRTAFV